MPISPPRPIVSLAVMAASVIGIMVASIFVPPMAAKAAPPIATIAQVMPAQSESLTALLAMPASSIDHRQDFTDLTTPSASWSEWPSTDIPAVIYNKGLNNQLGVQIVTVTNPDASARVCVEWITRTVNGTNVADCSTRAASVTATCSAASTTDKNYVLPGMTRQFVIGPSECVFYRTTVDQSDVQLSVIAR